MSDFLVFIDTNIFLDFYRLRGREKSLSILGHVAEHQDRFIITSQVEMEFKKNRQRVIRESYERIRPPSFDDLVQLPAFLSDSKQSKAIETHRGKVKTLAKKMRERTERVLRTPTRSDPVYKAAQRHFTYSSPYNLDRTKKIRFKIRRLARKRYLLGYPPRKAGDTSMGDAVNWEWIIHCAEESGKNIVIVSRDSDYGVTFGGGPILNDWLEQEFHKRVSKKRKIVLTNRLSEGLKAADIGVTETEINAEEDFLESQESYDDLSDLAANVHTKYADIVPQSKLAEIGRTLGAMKEIQRSFELPESTLRALKKAREGFALPESTLRALKKAQEGFALPDSTLQAIKSIQEQAAPAAEHLRAIQEQFAEPAKRLREQMVEPVRQVKELQRQLIGPVQELQRQLDSLGLPQVKKKLTDEDGDED